MQLKIWLAVQKELPLHLILMQILPGLSTLFLSYWFLNAFVLILFFKSATLNKSKFEAIVVFISFRIVCI